MPTTTLEQAWERVDWYRQRWLVEDDHHCLTRGCRIEERQVQSVDSLMRRLWWLSPLAVRWLQIRAAARAEPERPAQAGDRAGAAGRGGPALWERACHDDAGHLLEGGGTSGRVSGTNA
jgi:hypothetical protein